MLSLEYLIKKIQKQISNGGHFFIFYEFMGLNRNFTVTSLNLIILEKTLVVKYKYHTIEK